MRLNPLLAALACLWTTVLGASGPTTPLPNIRGVNLGVYPQKQHTRIKTAANFYKRQATGWSMKHG